MAIKTEGLSEEEARELIEKEEEVRDLIRKMREYGDNDAKTRLFEIYDSYVKGMARKILNKYDIPGDRRADIAEELYQSGWIGFIKALKRFKYDEDIKTKFSTYSYWYIQGEMKSELKEQFNTLGLTHFDYAGKYTRVEDDVYSDSISGEVEKTLRDDGNDFSVPEAKNKGKYSNERIALQIIEALRRFSDEDHRLSERDLLDKIRLYNSALHENCTEIAKDNNAITRTFQPALAEVLLEINSLAEKKDNRDDYKIKYDGFEDGYLQGRITMDAENPEKVKTAPAINGLYYNHTFNKEELDVLIQMICFSDIISGEEKENLICKLVEEGSPYYESSFWDGDSLRFNPKAIYGRFTGRSKSDKLNLINNIKKIQEALNNLGQISFVFNRYTDNKDLTPTDRSLRERYMLSPYHLVVYHDNYYCIGLLENKKMVMHYRVDLMSDIEIVRDGDGKIVPIELTAFEGLPIANAEWDPEKYMAEHLNMGFDDPKEIRIKIDNTSKGYTIIHDWFGNHFEKTNEPCEEGFDIVKVKTSPFMIIPWAMQYGTQVEIMDDEIRKEIKNRLKEMGEKYGNYGN